MDINGLFGNAFVKKAALGTLRKSMAKNNLSAIVVRLVRAADGDDTEDDFQFEMHTDDCVMISRADLEMYQAAVVQNLTHASQSAPTDAP